MNIRRFGALAVLCLIVGAAVFFAVNTSKSSRTSDKLQVSASFYPLYDIAQNIGGDKVAVTTITPPGAEPHDFEPSPKDLISVEGSDVFIYNGGNFEPWVNDFIKNYAHVAVKASNHVALHHEAEESQEAHEEHADHGSLDPHFWLDPVLAQQITRNIRDGLVKADPANKDYYDKNSEQYIHKLQKLDADYQAGLAQCAQNTVITAHEAFGYVAERYNFTAEAITGISPDEEPSSSKLAKLTEMAKQKQIKYIFFESLVSPRLADTIAQEVGAQTLVFNPLEGLTQDEQKAGKNYLTIQYENLKNLRTALACQ